MGGLQHIMPALEYFPGYLQAVGGGGGWVVTDSSKAEPQPWDPVCLTPSLPLPEEPWLRPMTLLLAPSIEKWLRVEISGLLQG